MRRQQLQVKKAMEATNDRKMFYQNGTDRHCGQRYQPGRGGM